MTFPFRFGVQVSGLPASGWQDYVRKVEALGYSTLFVPDHFGTQWDPTAFCAGVAAVTERLNVGTLVYDVDYRHPVIHAKSAATIQLLSGGRHEFGLGAGWMRTDYDEAGMPYDRPGIRIQRLEEALEICRAMWTRDETSFEGRHYRVQEIARAVEAPDDFVPPKVLVGGGGPKVLGVAARHADIVGINPSLPEGRITRDSAADLRPEKTREKVGWVREAAEAAGRDPAAIELTTLVFVVAITDDPKPIREGLAANSGMSIDEVADNPIFLTGPASEIRERLEARREALGLSYVVIQGRTPELLEQFAAEIVEPLAGS